MRSISLCLMLVAGFLGVVVPVAGQIPDEFTNLQILRKDIGRQELVSIMRDFSMALGVRCKFCHVGESESSLDGYDFASDEPDHKRVARGMMKMTGDVNEKLLPASGVREPMRVRCVTCHRGLKEPAGLDQVLAEAADEGGAARAAERYRELRAEYLGRGAYDFGPGTLIEMAERLARDRDLEGARSLTELNLEVHPDDVRSHLTLAQLHLSEGNREAARASVQQALEIEPDNDFAKRMLQRMSPTE